MKLQNAKRIEKERRNYKNILYVINDNAFAS